MAVYRKHMNSVVGAGKSDVDRYVAELAARLVDRVPDAVSLIDASVREEIPEMIPDTRDEAQIALLDDAIQGNVEIILYALRHNISVEDVQAPTAAVEHTRRLAQQGVPLNALIRGYRLGQRRLTHLVFGELHSINIAPESRISVVETITEMLFAYVDWMSQQIIATYEEERERWLESNNSVLALRVREVLAGRKQVDVDWATNAIRYPLRWHHVGLVLWYPVASPEADDLNRLLRFVRALGPGVKAAAAPLFVATDSASGWAWLPFQSAPVEVADAVKRFALQRNDSPNVTIGSPAMGVDGFRRSHYQAEAARAVALAQGDAEAIVLANSDPGVAAAALLGGNIEQARYWVAEVLGRLASPTDNDALLRETLWVFLSCGASYKLAAEELVLHFNTVKYRVGRALARRERRITSDRLDVELALLLCRWYGSAVLLRPAT
jgi:DNA-binding PucR family transcriptional regulator